MISCRPRPLITDVSRFNAFTLHRREAALSLPSYLRRSWVLREMKRARSSRWHARGSLLRGDKEATRFGEQPQDLEQPRLGLFYARRWRQRRNAVHNRAGQQARDQAMRCGSRARLRARRESAVAAITREAVSAKRTKNGEGCSRGSGWTMSLVAWQIRRSGTCAT
ncbi:hypothetical protein Dimus_015669 [Dionaea muscipula]